MSAPDTPDTLGLQDSDTLRRAIRLVRVLRNPALPGLVFLLLLVVTGCVVLAFSVFAISDALYVPLQMPFLVSGGFTGVAFVAAGALLAAVQAERHDRAQARFEMQEAVDELSALVRSSARMHRAAVAGAGDDDPARQPLSESI